MENKGKLILTPYGSMSAHEMWYGYTLMVFFLGLGVLEVEFTKIRKFFF